MSGNPSEQLDPIEETFGEVAVLVPVAIIFALLDAVVARGDDGASAPRARIFPMKLSASYALSAITLLGLKPSSSAGAWEMSVAAWNLVVNSPQERPMACGSSIFLSRPRAVLSGMNSSRSASPQSRSTICFQTPFYVRR